LVGNNSGYYHPRGGLQLCRCEYVIHLGFTGLVQLRGRVYSSRSFVV